MEAPSKTRVQIWAIETMIQGVNDHIDEAKHNPLIDVPYWQGRHDGYAQVLRMLENTDLQERKEPLELILAKMRKA